MTSLSRRDVLRSGTLAAAACVVPHALGRAARAGAGHLVIVRLRGGADGLSMVVPWRDPQYYRARPVTAIPAPGGGPRGALLLDASVGLNPRMASLMPLFRDGTLDVVTACGMEEGTRSHLLADEALDRLIAGLAAGGTARPSIGLDGSEPLSRSLARVAAAVKAGSAPAVIVVESRGWDHHEAQDDGEGPFATSLDDLSRSLAACAHALGRHLASTTLVTVSEFGRAVAENCRGGTEHGRASAMLVIGGPRRRGRVIGGAPRLDDATGVPPTVFLADALAQLAPVSRGEADALPRT
jgi:uncharacterized protein (DUF1501 family)